MISAIRAAPPRVLFLAVAVAVVGLMTVTDLPSASPVHAQEQAVTATRDATGESPPARPTDLQASAGPDSVSLTWTASTDQTVTHYAVLLRDRDKADAGVFEVIDSNAGSATSYTDGSVSPGGSYVYRVKAVSPTGVSQWSSYARADIPADPEDLAPSGLSAKAVFDGGDSAGVALSWDAPAADAASVTGYEILRAVGDGDLATLVADTGSADTTYADDTATKAGESYAYGSRPCGARRRASPPTGPRWSSRRSRRFRSNPASRRGRAGRRRPGSPTPHRLWPLAGSVLETRTRDTLRVSGRERNRADTAWVRSGSMSTTKTSNPGRHSPSTSTPRTRMAPSIPWCTP